MARPMASAVAATSPGDDGGGMTCDGGGESERIRALRARIRDGRAAIVDARCVRSMPLGGPLLPSLVFSGSSSESGCPRGVCTGEQSGDETGSGLDGSCGIERFANETSEFSFGGGEGREGVDSLSTE